MNYAESIIADLALSLAIASVIIYLFYRLKQPMILGYLITGVIVGPYTPPFSFITNPAVFSASADVGMILLLFGIGLQFPIPRLRTVGKVSAAVAGIEIAFMLLLSFGVSRLLDWPLIDALFLGTALASSSTTIIAKVLGDLGKLQEIPALVMLGILVVEDLVVVGLLAVLTSTVTAGTLELSSFGWMVGKILAFVLGTLILGILLVPRLINKVIELDNNEVLVVVAVAFCFGFAVLASLLGFSIAIGAFLIGVVIASSKCAGCVATVIAPLKDLFAAIFFISMGALIDVTQFRDFLLPSLLITVLMLFGKVFGCGIGTKIFGYSNSTSIKVGMGMSQIGEFAFIVMKAGQDLGAISPFLFPVVGVAAGITTFLTPYLIKISYQVDPAFFKIKWSRRKQPRR